MDNLRTRMRSRTGRGHGRLWIGHGLTVDYARLRIARGKSVSVEKSWTWKNRDRGKTWNVGGRLEILDDAWLLDGHTATIARTQNPRFCEE